MPLLSQNPNDNNDGMWKQALVSVGIALSIPSTFGIPLGLGIYLDSQYHTAPQWMLILGGFGLLGMAVELFQIWKRSGQKD
ncbi:MAG: hypothetical protein K1Y36_00040 [Blastocatellia bacterium]|nr:hypothetical protein [Blastocatellia bacterium]